MLCVVMLGVVMLCVMLCDDVVMLCGDLKLFEGLGFDDRLTDRRTNGHLYF